MIGFNEGRFAQEEASTARSLPLGALAAFCGGQDVVIAGIFAPALRSYVGDARIIGSFIPGTRGEVISAPVDPANGARRVEPSALAACMPRCDVLVLTDAAWCDAIVGDPDVLAMLALKVRNRIVLALKSPPLAAACRWIRGHSWTESDDSSVWIWADSEQSLIEAELCMLRPFRRQAGLKFRIMTRPDAAGSLTVDVAGERSTVAVPSEWITIPFCTDDTVLPICWQVDIPPVSLPPDCRRLSFGLVDAHLVAEDGSIIAPPVEFMQHADGATSTPRTARSALHRAGFTVVHSLASSSDGNRRERFSGSSFIMPEPLDCIDQDKGSAAPILMDKGDVCWLFASKSLAIAPTGRHG